MVVMEHRDYKVGISGGRKTLVYGVGRNDAEYSTKKCLYYRKWKGMIARCYSSRLKYKMYEDVWVCEEWHSFMNFRKWMETQDWEGKCLDKDLLVIGNKVYSPETCIFVSSAVNSFCQVSRKGVRGLPVGVKPARCGKRYWAYCSNIFTGEREYLGVENTPEDAHKLYLNRKHQLALQLADLQKDVRVANALRTRYKPD